MRPTPFALALLLAAAPAGAEPYHPPPPAVLEALRAPAPPVGFINPTHDTLLLATPVRFVPIADLSPPSPASRTTATSACSRSPAGRR